MRAQNVREFAGSGESGGVALVGKKFDSAAFEEGSFRRQAARGFVFGGELAGFDFAGFDVRLIERIDADNGAGDGSGNFPAKEFLAERVDVRKGDANDGMTGFFESGDGGILGFVGFGGQAQIGEDTVVAVSLRLGKLFAIHGNDAPADFSGRFGDELLEPGA